MPRASQRRKLPVPAAALAALLAAPLASVVPPEATPAADKAFRHPDLAFRDVHRPVRELPAAAAAQARRDLSQLGMAESGARVDLRGRRFATLLAARPLVPGEGVGNDLRWDVLKVAPPRDRGALEGAAWQAFRDFVDQHRAALGVDPVELRRSAVTVSGDGRLIQIHAQRVVGGVTVRGSYLTATLVHGNLVLYGARNWGDVSGPTDPKLTVEDALTAMQDFLRPLEIRDAWQKPELLLLPMARGHAPEEIELGRGYAYRLAWALRPSLADDDGRWEVLIDARSGEVLAFEDTSTYATARRVAGGVYPLSNDGAASDGVEQAGWPMPFDKVSSAAGTLTADSGGNLPLCVDGNVTSNLSGRFVRVVDQCGAIGLTSPGDLDFGTSAGTDCATPGFGGAGNTHASRTNFHQLNRIAEQARGWLPANAWLQTRLTSNVNVSAACNASWNGTTVNFFCSVPGTCANSGELAGVIDHEWGHGLDDNDANPTISNPGEGIADLYAYLRTDTSCIGRGFRLGANCGGYGDACTSCDGVRDVDFAKRASGLPHDVTWIEAHCGTGNATPCGGVTHCEGAVYAEAVYDLVNRDLPALFGMGHNTALEVGSRLTYLGGGNVGTWFQCVVPFGGCNADGGYLNFLAADDDNGDLADGTPHMSAIFAAFDRHGIACATPAVADSGCAGTPAAAPAVAAAAADRGATLSWGAVAGATEYHVFRTDGVAACDQGKAKVGETTGLTFTDGGLQNGRAYSYVVIPIGAADTCMGPASACTSVTPVAGPNLAVDAAGGTFSILSVADGDDLLDNCELANLTFEVANTGTGSLTNVRIVSATSPTHPSFTFVTSFPSPVTPSTLLDCDTGVGTVDFIAGGLVPNDVVEIQVEVTADELPSSRTASFFIDRTEGDFQAVASQTFSFDADFDGWQVISGTFARDSEGGGALGTPFYLESSEFLPNRCDVVRSPRIRLSPTSTLELHSRFAIEDASLACPLLVCKLSYYDRANVGLFKVATGTRTLVTPDGGRPYNAGGANGTCGTNGQAGWAGTAITFGPSTWSATALGAAALAGSEVRLDVRYGTDGLVQNQGFQFDQVVLTDFELLVADGQPDVCAAECAVDADCDDGLFCNGAETCLAGVCIVGPAPCGDGVGCTVDTCDEALDACANTPSDALCDDGLFCDGAETCDPVLDCQGGTPVDCDDGVGCTADACNETLDVCDNVPDAGLCQNGLFCDGTEVCDPLLDCQPGTPIDCNDAVACTVDACNETTDACDHTASDAFCDNGLFCDGAETCNPLLDCQLGPDPCTPFACDDVLDECVGTPVAQLEAGVVEVGGTRVTVSLTHAYLKPVIVTTTSYGNAIPPAVNRISNVFPTHFDVRRQNPSDAASVGGSRTVHYMVVEEGSWIMDGLPVDAQRYLSTVTDGSTTGWVGEARSYGQPFAAPVVLGQVMSTNDPSWSTFWTHGPTRFEPPTPTSLFAGKTVCQDSDLTRADETVGLVVFETGHGTLNGVEYEARVGGDTIRGSADSPTTFYSYLTPFAKVPSVGLATQAGVDDNDGCFAKLHGDPAASNIFLTIDEDQIFDTERNHSTEQVGYVVFADPLVFPPVALSDLDRDGLQNNVDPCLGDDDTGDLDGDGVCADLDCDDTDPAVAMLDTCGVCGGDNTLCGGNQAVGDLATMSLWHLNNDGTDAGGGGNDLAVKSDRVRFLPGRFGLAAEMGSDPWTGDCSSSDGGALAAPGGGTSYPGSGDWTVEAWIKVASYDAGYTVVSHYTEFWEGHEPFELRLDPGGQLVFAITDSANRTATVSAPVTAPAGDWVHVAAVYRERQSLELYQNFEILAHRETTLLPETLTSFDVYVGGTWCGTSTGLSVDDVRLSSFARFQGCLGDADGDGVCDGLDVCPGFADGADADLDGVPDGCDLCQGDDDAGDADLDGVCADLDCSDVDPSAVAVDGCGVCGGHNAACGIFSDGFESGDTSSWS